MSRVYAIREDDQKRILVEISCDSCSAKIKPNPNIANSGWIKNGTDRGLGTGELEWHYCPNCQGRH
jgi:hypothetical protein